MGMGCWSQTTATAAREHHMSRWQSKMERMQDKMDRLRNRMETSAKRDEWSGQPRSSGNRAFDDYRAETLRRLEDEQREFKEFSRAAALCQGSGGVRPVHGRASQSLRTMKVRSRRPEH